MARFLEEAKEALDLNDEELRFVAETGIRSFDSLFARLQASPSLARTKPAIRRDRLLDALDGLLSREMRGNLAVVPDMPPPSALMRGPASPHPTPDWPGKDGLPSLAGAPALDLLSGLAKDGWPVRRQGKGTLTCVAFATAAALERFWTPAAPERLSPLSLNAGIRALGPGQAASGGSLLEEADKAMQKTGILRHAEWPDTQPPHAAPPPALLARARRDDLLCWRPGPFAQRWPGIARAAWELLRSGRPVAVSLPYLHDPQLTPDANNWRGADAWTWGTVLTPEEDWVIEPVGHAVCLLGFQPDPTEPVGGFFVFRNSWGLGWASAAPSRLGAPVPRTPAPGYGTLPAAYLDRWASELLAPA